MIILAGHTLRDSLHSKIMWRLQWSPVLYPKKQKEIGCVCVISPSPASSIRVLIQDISNLTQRPKHLSRFQLMTQGPFALPSGSVSLLCWTEGRAEAALVDSARGVARAMLIEHSKQDMEEIRSWTWAVTEPPHLPPATLLIVRKWGELRATEHTMMLREVAFINTQGSGPSPANNRGNGDGGQWVWSVGKARMTPSMTIAEQAVGGGGSAPGGWGLGTKQYKLPGDPVATTKGSGCCK